MPAPDPNEARRELLAEALQLSRQILNKDDNLDSALTQRRRERLQVLQEKLQSFAHPVQIAAIAPDSIPLTVRQAFVRASILVTRYQKLGGQHWSGTLDSPTLSRYQSDPIPATWMSQEAIAQLSQAFELTDTHQTDLAKLLQSVDQRINQQQRLMEAVLKTVGLDTINLADSSITIEIPDAISKLFLLLFGEIPIPAEKIHCLFTPAQLYFCINYDNEQLSDTECWDSLSPNDQDQIQCFLATLGEFSFEQFERFPIFGACNPERIDAQWCDRLAEQLQLPASDIRRTLSRSVSIIPTQKAEAFLIHDIWGHYWQAVLTEFEQDYRILADCDRPLRAGETAYTPYGPLTCRDLFNVAESNVFLDEERSRLFFHGEVQQRLGLLFTHLLGEMVADMAEFKFVWDHPDLMDQLPSSSLFKNYPAKLDLSLGDIDFLFLRVLQPLLEMTLSVRTESLLETELLSQWAAENHPVESLEFRISLKRAIAALYQLFLDEYNRNYLPTINGSVGIFTQATSNLLYLQNAVNQLYTSDIAKTTADLPFQDLLMIFIATYCSTNGYQDFWDIDNAIAQYFLPCWQILTQCHLHPTDLTLAN